MREPNFMSRHARRFRKGPALFLALAFAGMAAVFPVSSPASEYSKREAVLYRDVFDQNFYYEGTQYLRLERLYRDLFGIRKRALDVNVFDEIPDSSFFTNRKGREKMSLAGLKQGAVTVTPDRGTHWTIVKGKFGGITPGFLVKNEKGDKYLLKFDPLDNLELATGAEVITSRFMHALGYNVPEYVLVRFKRDDLEIDPKAKIYDESGFKKQLTPERLEEFLLFIPETEDGLYRASASRYLGGELLGPMQLQGRRRNDPDDLVNHEERRELRALQVFSAWLNNNDARTSNTLDTVGADGRIRHYIIDFNSSLGATPRGPKPPMFGHEYMVDYGESAKAFFGFGFWKKPWQKRWEEAGQEVQSPSVGYFDNRYFDPGKYKTQLPHYVFKDLTNGDGFWAAKILMRFTDEDIDTVVETGEYTDKEAQKIIAQVLKERRDLIAKYWFKKANPLDGFELHKTGEGYELRFEDLAIHYGFEPKEGTVYRVDVIGKEGKKGLRLDREEIQAPVFPLNPEWLASHPEVDLLIRTQRPGEKGWGPFVRVQIQSEADSTHLTGILHQD